MSSLLILPDGSAFSYKTRILHVTAEGLKIGNVTRYSKTTSGHQHRVGVFEAQIRLDKVERGTTDLLKLAIDRGLVEESK